MEINWGQINVLKDTANYAMDCDIENISSHLLMSSTPYNIQFFEVNFPVKKQWLSGFWSGDAKPMDVRINLYTRIPFRLISAPNTTQTDLNTEKKHRWGRKKKKHFILGTRTSSWGSFFSLLLNLYDYFSLEKLDIILLEFLLNS